MEDIKNYISKKRESLSKSSLTTYGSILKNLYEKVFSDKEYDLTKFSDSKKVLDFLKDIPPNRRKTILSALVIITDKKEYREVMAEDVRDYNKEISKQEKTETQEDAWVTSSDIKELYDELKKNADLLYKKKNLTQSDLQEIQSFIILAVLSGIHIPVRRSKDFCDFKIKTISDKDNFLDKNKLIFNSYKTAKTYGKQEVPCPLALKTILTKWSKINPTDYLLFDTNLNPLTSVKLNQRLNKLFGKHTSVNALRHTYLTEKFGDSIAKKKEIDNVMADMGSSAGMLDTYVKND